jgi:serine/threonine-protein kinase HipA
MRLVVCLNGVIAGHVESAGRRLSFQYADGWLTSDGAYPLSASMMLQPEPYVGATVANFLWGLLPDNPRLLESWGRQFQVSPNNVLGLLAHVGEDCAGAIQFATEEKLDSILAKARARPQVDWLTQAELERRIRTLAQDGSAIRIDATEGQFSLPGAQPKTALHYDAARRRWGVPRGRTPTTHIFKPVTNGLDGFAENEHFCLELARALELGASFSEWRVIGGVHVLVSTRFDRIQQNRRWVRIHQEDSCQALGRHPSQKYQNEGGPGIKDVMTLLQQTDQPEVDRMRFMRAMIFNYLIAATDAHAKNYSILWTGGHNRPSTRLAPLYDIASMWAYPQHAARKIKLAMSIGGHYRISEILPRHFGKTALACGLSPTWAHTEVRRMTEMLPDVASQVARTTVVKGMNTKVLDHLIDGIARQCTAARRALKATDKAADKAG